MKCWSSCIDVCWQKQTVRILSCNSESIRRGSARTHERDMNAGIHVGLEPFEDSLIKDFAVGTHNSSV